MDAQLKVMAEDVPVAAKPRRRTYAAEYKRRILKEAGACPTPGARALLRQEGLLLALARLAPRPARGELAALTSKKRWRQPEPVDLRDRKIADLERQRAVMRGLAARAEALVDAHRTTACAVRSLDGDVRAAAV